MPRFTNPVPQYNYIDPISSEFGPLKEGKLYLFESQTNTPLTTYKDAFLTIPNTHPIILDAGGNVPNVFFEGTARVVLTDQNDVQQWERDPVGGENEFGQLSLWQPTVEYGSNDYVIGSDGKIYKSRNASNTGNDPTSSPNDWLEQEFLGVWNNTFPYAVGNIVRTSTGNLWKSLTANNLTNDPETDSGTNWIPAVDGAKIPEVIALQTDVAKVLSWPVENANFTAASSEAKQIDATSNTVDVTIPAIALGDVFTFHNWKASTNKVQILNPSYTIIGKIGNLSAGTDLELLPGQSVQMIAKSTTELEIVGAFL